MTGRDEETLICRHCKQRLPIGLFKSSKRKKSGVDNACRPCVNQLARASYRAKQDAAGKEARWGPEDQDGLRQCRACKQWLPLGDYSPAVSNKSGLSSYCRPCNNLRNAKASAAKAAAEGREVRKLRKGFPDDHDGQRMCRDCERWFPLETFPVQATRKSGHGSYCRACMNVRTQASYAKGIFEREDREVRKPEDLPEGLKRCSACKEVKALGEFVGAKANTSGVHSYCKPCFNARAKASVVKHHGSTRNFHLKRRYGITEAEVDQMLEAQRGVCAICAHERPPFHVDHDHETGRVRGLLCFNCNNGLGHFKDDIDVLQAAIDYIFESWAVPGPKDRFVPEDMIDPKGTWIEQRTRLERELRGVLGNLDPAWGWEAPGPDTTTGRESP